MRREDVLAPFQYRKRYGLHAIFPEAESGRVYVVSIPQAVWIACNRLLARKESSLGKFQYRKRYGLHAILHALRTVGSYDCFNTASGMDCMQWRTSLRKCGRLTFQYRKRYGLHAMILPYRRYDGVNSFNTASGMDCMQYCLPEPLKTVNPKGGFLVRPPFLRFSPNLREFFCRKKRFKRGAKPAISRKLLSTRKT